MRMIVQDDSLFLPVNVSFEPHVLGPGKNDPLQTCTGIMFLQALHHYFIYPKRTTERREGKGSEDRDLK